MKASTIKELNEEHEKMGRMPTKKFGTMRLDFSEPSIKYNTGSNNSLSDDTDDLRELIMRKVRESENNARTGISKKNDGSIMPKYPNNVIINWPPDKEDFKNLCKAINLKIDEKQAIEAILYSKGPKMLNENFSFERLINWI